MASRPSGLALGPDGVVHGVERGFWVIYGQGWAKTSDSSCHCGPRRPCSLDFLLLNAGSSPLCLFPLTSVSLHAFTPFSCGLLLFFKCCHVSGQAHATRSCFSRACDRSSVTIQPVKELVCASNPISSLIPPGLVCSLPGLHTFLGHLSTPGFFSKKSSTILQLPGQTLGARSSPWFPTHATRSHGLASPLTFAQTLVAHHGDSLTLSCTLDFNHFLIQHPSSRSSANPDVLRAVVVMGLVLSSLHPGFFLPEPASRP